MQPIGTALMKRARRMEHRLHSLVDRLLQREPGRRVVFLHIPKCAGSSVNMLFKSRIGSARSGRTVTIDDRAPRAELDQLVARARDAQFVGGHFGMETLERVRGDAFVFTVLRDPYDRLRSIYGHLATRADVRPVGDRVQGMSLADFVASQDPLILQWSDNVMARMLVARHDRESVAGLSTGELARRAIANARVFDHIAFLGTLDRDIATVATAAGVRYDGKLGRENTTMAKAAVPPPRAALERLSAEERALAAPRVAADIELYERLRAERSAPAGSSAA
jgi:hypothetical protein